MFRSITTCLLAAITNAMYNQGGPVVLLNKNNWQDEVMKSDSLWLVEFYAPWCGHCKSLAPSWELAAKQLKGVVKVGAVDMTTDQEVGAPYDVKGFPTLKWFGFDKKKPEDYSSGRDADSIRDFALGKIKSEVSGRMNKKSKSSSSSEGEKKSGNQKQQEPITDKDVIVLDDSNFDSLVLGSKDIWLVEFYAPWCGHCKALEPEWNNAAAALKGKVKVAKVDATVSEKLARRFSVSGYPTIKYFDYGEGKTDSKAQSYEGARTAEGIKALANDLLTKADIEPDIWELNSQAVYDRECKGQVICVVAFLPNIYESNAAERKSYLSLIKQTAKSNRNQPFTFFWLQAGDQLDLERALNLGFGYPAVIAVSPHKSVVATMTASFNKENVSSFLTKVMSGSARVSDLPKNGFSFKKTTAWDGKDAAPIIEDSYDDL